MVRLNLLIFMAREDRFVALGYADRRVSFDDAMLLLGDQLSVGGVYRLLAEHGM